MHQKTSHKPGKQTVLMIDFSDLKLVSWNVNGIPKYNTPRLRRIIKHLNFLTRSHQVILIQETHLNPHQSNRFGRRFPNHLILSNPHTTSSAGTLIIINKAYLNHSTHSHNIIIPGYAQQLIITPQHGIPFTIINNYVDPTNNTSKINHINRLIDTNIPSPSILAGDWNFIESMSDATHFSPHHRLSQGLQSAVNELASKHSITQTTSDVRTHLHPTNSARLDRFYLAMEQALYTQYQPTVSHPITLTPNNPLYSDHLPVALSFQNPNPGRHNSDKAVAWTITSPHFLPYLEQLWDQTPLYARTLPNLKAIITLVTKYIARKHPVAPLTFVHQLTIANKALKYALPNTRNIPALILLYMQHPFLQPHLSYPISQQPDTTALRTFINGIINLHAQPHDHQDHPYPKPNVLKQIKLTLPSTRRRLTAILDPSNPNDPPTTNPSRMTAVAKEFWGQLWSAKPDDQDRIDQYLSSYRTRIRSPIQKPTLHQVEQYINQTNNSTPGPDGIPFEAYRILSHITAPLILNLLEQLADPALQLPPGFNHSLLFLIPKTDNPTIQQTRPIQVPNTDNRILSGIVAESIHDQLSAVLTPKQTAFIRGRAIIDNVQDVIGRYASAVEQKKAKYLLLLDFRKAYDSVSHKFLLTTLHTIGMPSWVINTVAHLLSEQLTHLTAPFSPDIIPVQIGVKQGCPLSPILFIILIDTILDRLQHESDIHTRAYADDLSFLFEHLYSLLRIQYVINTYCHASGGHVNQTKTIIIPTTLNTHAINHTINHSHWTEVVVADRGKYLGFIVGREVRVSDSFVMPLRKFHKRVASYASARKHFPMYKRILIANTFLLSIFSYISLVYIIPKRMAKEVAKALRSFIPPFGSFSERSLTASPHFIWFNPTTKNITYQNIALIASRQQNPTPPPNIPNPDPNHPHPDHSHVIAYNTMRATHPHWRGGLPSKTNYSLLNSTHANNEQSTSYIHTRIERWHNKCVTQNPPINTTLLPLPIQQPPQPLSAYPILPSPINLPPNPNPFPPNALSANAAIRNWMAKSSKLPNHILAPTISLIHNSLATSDRTRHFADTFPCPFCGETDNAIHLTTQCPFTLLLSQTLQPMIKHTFPNHTLPTPPPVNLLLLSFPTSQNLTNLVILFTFTLWITHQQTKEQRRSPREALTRAPELFASASRQMKGPSITPDVWKRTREFAAAFRRQLSSEPFFTYLSLPSLPSSVSPLPTLASPGQFQILSGADANLNNGLPQFWIGRRRRAGRNRFTIYGPPSPCLETILKQSSRRLFMDVDGEYIDGAHSLRNARKHFPLATDWWWELVNDDCPVSRPFDHQDLRLVTPPRGSVDWNLTFPPD
jgi:exonuclease III